MMYVLVCDSEPAHIYTSKEKCLETFNKFCRNEAEYGDGQLERDYKYWKKSHNGSVDDFIEDCFETDGYLCGIAWYEAEVD